jgi:hypothetical protein
MIDIHKKKKQKKTKKIENLINNIKTKGWNVNPILILIVGACGSTHKKFITKIKTIYNISKQQTKTLAEQININAIRYSMHMLLCKRKLKNNQPAPEFSHSLTNLDSGKCALASAWQFCRIIRRHDSFVKKEELQA